MADVSAVIDIDAAPQEVWDVATDLGRIGEWVSIHRDFPEPPPEDLAAGGSFKQTFKVAGTSFRVEWTATEVEGPERLCWHGTGPAGTKARTEYTLEAKDGGTRFTYENRFTLPAGKLGKAAGKVVAKRAKKELDDSLGKLKEIVEA